MCTWFFLQTLSTAKEYLFPGQKYKRQLSVALERLKEVEAELEALKLQQVCKRDPVYNVVVVELNSCIPLPPPRLAKFSSVFIPVTLKF